MENDSFIKTGYEWERIQDVEIILRKTIKLTDELLARYPDAEAIGLTGQMHGIVYVDGKGKHCSPLYTWQDGRGNLPIEPEKTEAEKTEPEKSEVKKSESEKTEAEELESRKSEPMKLKSEKSLVDSVLEETSLSAATGYGLVTHLYNLRHGLVPPEAAALCTISDYLGMTLAGRKTPLVHGSNAASMGFFDSRCLAFCRNALEKVGIDICILPQLADDFTSLGTYQGIPVAVAIGDNQASFLGSVGMNKNTVLLNMGTGGQLSVLSNQYFEEPGIEARPFLEGEYLLVGSSLCGGRAYAVLEHFFRSYLQHCEASVSSQYDLMGKLAEEGKKVKDKVKIRTTFSGTRSNPALRGSITNLSEDNFTPESLTYGVLEGMAQELYEMYETMHAGTGVEAERLVVSGNGFRRNPVLLDICRKKFGATLSLAEFKEEAACGAAIYATMIMQ